MGQRSNYRKPPKVGTSVAMAIPVDDDNIEVVKSSMKYMKPAVLNTPLPDGARCPDGIHFSGDTSAQIVCADNTDAEAVTITLAGGIFHPISVKKVISVTNGVTVTLGWFVKP